MLALKFFLFGCLVVLFALAGTYFYATSYYTAKGPLTNQTTVFIESGTPFRSIVKQLETEGVIDQPLLFEAMVALRGDQKRFKAGEYLFLPKVSPAEVAERLKGGEFIVHSLTIPEGLVTRDILHIIAKEPLLKGDIPEIVAEGSLLPETYHFHRGDTRQSLINRMQQAQQRVLSDAWENRQANLPLASPQDALILASIVEKETGLPDERDRVAGVFINRLNKGMRLQSDPTTIYGVYKETGELIQVLYRSQLRAETPYNTYVISGLPPTPICNPGEEAIRATLNPKNTEELYFVADGTGGHAFAKTLREHNRNVRRWRALQR
jgi:UPF0755 protein